MSVVMEGEIKLWTAQSKSALMLEFIPGKRAVAAAIRQFDLPPKPEDRAIENGAVCFI